MKTDMISIIASIVAGIEIYVVQTETPWKLFIKRFNDIGDLTRLISSDRQITHYFSK